MARIEYLILKTEKEMADLMGSGLNELKSAVGKLMNDAILLGVLDFITSFLKWIASLAAIYLLILDRTSWRTNMVTSLLLPYLVVTLPSVFFEFLRGEYGKWIALCTIVFRLYSAPVVFQNKFLEIPGALILLLVVSQCFDYLGLVIGFYLLNQHVKSSGGCRTSFTQRHAFDYSPRLFC